MAPIKHEIQVWPGNTRAQHTRGPYRGARAREGLTEHASLKIVYSYLVQCRKRDIYRFTIGIGFVYIKDAYLNYVLVHIHLYKDNTHLYKDYTQTERTLTMNYAVVCNYNIHSLMCKYTSFSLPTCRNPSLLCSLTLDDPSRIHDIGVSP